MNYTITVDEDASVRGIRYLQGGNANRKPTLSVSTGTTVEGETGDWKDVVLDGLGNGIVGVTLNQSSAILRHVTVSNFFSRGVAV